MARCQGCRNGDGCYAEAASDCDTFTEREVCQWFALCANPATGTTPHPVLGDVPTCDRCKARAS